METREPLSREAEIRAFRRLRAGDEGARAEIALANVRYALSLAGRFYGDREENESKALLGLCQAIDRFDPERGFKFITYARSWILLHLRLDVDAAVKRPQRIRSLRKHAEEHRARMSQESGEEVGLGDACDDLGYTEKEMREILSIYEAEFPLDANGDTLSAESPEIDYVREKIERAIDELPPQSRECVRLYYGIMDIPDPLKFAAIGQRWGVTRQRAQQVHKAALEALRQNPVLQQMMEELSEETCR